MKEVQNIKRYYKKYKSMNIDKETKFLLNNKELILITFKKIPPLTFPKIKKTSIKKNIEDKDYKVTKDELNNYLKMYHSLEECLLDINIILIKRLNELIEYEELKIKDYQRIEDTFLKLKKEKSISINKYYNMSDDLKNYSLFFLLEKIKNETNKTKLLDVIFMSLSIQNKNIQKILEEYQNTVYQNMTLIHNILKSFLCINKLPSTLFTPFKTYKKSYTRPTVPVDVNLLSNNNYTIFLDNAGKTISKYKDITLFKQDTTTSTIHDLDNNTIYSLTAYDENSKYKNIFNEAITSYIKKYEEFSIKTEITVAIDKELELRKYTIKNVHYAPKTFTCKFTLPIIFFNNNNYKYKKSIKNTYYSKGISSFITYSEENNLFLTTKLLNRTNTNYKIENNIIEISFKIKLNPNEEKVFFLTHLITNNKREIYKLPKNDSYTIYDTIFFKTNILKNNTEYKDFILYHDFLNLILSTNKKRDLNRNNLILKNSFSISTLYKYQISGDYKIILIDLFSNYNLETMVEILNFYKYLKENGFYIDLIILYNKEKEKLIKLKKYFDILNFNKNTPGTLFLIDKTTLTLDEVASFKIFATISIELKDKYTLKEIVTRLKGQNTRKKTLQEFKNFLIEEEKLKNEIHFSTNVLEEDLPIYKEKKTKDIVRTIPDNLFLKSNNGGFDLEHDEYIITDSSLEFNTFLSNTYFYGIFSLQNKSVLATNNYFINETNGYYELFINNKQLLFDTIHVGFGYTLFEKKEEEKEITLTKFISTIDNILFNKFEIKNKSNKKIVLNIKFLLLPLLGLKRSDARYLTCNFLKDSNLLKIRNKKTGQLLFISSTKSFQEVILDEFKEKILEIEITLEENEKKSFAIFLGVNPNKSYFLENNEEIYNKNILLLREKYSSISVVDNSLHLTKIHFRDSISRLKINTSDELFNLMSKWQIYETLIFNGYDRACFLEHTFLYTLHNLLIDSLNLMFLIPEYSKKNMIKCLEHVTNSGEILASFNTLKDIGNISTNLKEIILLFYNIKKYIDISEDYNFLSVECSYINISHGVGDEVYFKKSKSKDSVFSHLERIVGFILEKESTNKIFMWKILHLFIEITKYYDKNKDIKNYREKEEELYKDILTIPDTRSNLIYKIIFDIKFTNNKNIIKKIYTNENKLLVVYALLKLKKIEEAYRLYKELNYLNNAKKEAYFSFSSTLYYRIGIELFLGFNRIGKKLVIKPNLPSSTEYEISYKYYNTIYLIKVIKNNTKSYITVDKEEVEYISLKNDYKKHKVEVYYKEKRC